MKTKITSILLFTLVFFYSLTNLQATPPKIYKPRYSNPFNEPWRWRNYPELNGRGCRCMAEGKDGTLWFGVSGGIVRYDGYEWNFYSISEDSSDTPVVALYAANNGIIYAGTTEGISKYDNGNWIRLDLNLEFGDAQQYFFNKIPIIESSDSSIWIGTNQGALRLKNDRSVLYNFDDAIVNFDDTNITSTLPKDCDIYSMIEDESGKLWIGMRDGKIYNCQITNQDLNTPLNWKRRDNDANYFQIRYPLINQNNRGHIYIAGSQYGGGINIFNHIEWHHIRLKDTFRIDEIYTDIIKLHDGSICIAGLGRIFIEQNNEWKMYESPTFPFSSNRLIVHEAVDQSLWIIGLSNEVWKIDLSIQNWATLLGLNFQTEDQDGNYWFISFDEKIVQYHIATEKWFYYDHTNGVLDSPVAMMVTKGGKIWTAGSHKQVAAMAYFDGRNWIKQLHPNLGWSIDRRAVFEADDGSLWFGSSSDFMIEKGQLGGLVRYNQIDYKNPDKITYEYHHMTEEFTLGAVYGIGQSYDGLIWAGQFGFYNYDLDTKNWNRIIDPPGLNRSFVDCIDTSPDGDLWIGTRSDGVFWLNNVDGQWYNFTSESGLSSNTIVNIYAENKNNIWVTTDRNILHFDGASWMESVFSSYFENIRDGISILKTSEGSFWINQNPPIWYRKSLYNQNLSGVIYDKFKTIKYFPDNLAPETEITFSQEEVSQPGNVILAWIGNDPWGSSPTRDLQYSYRIDDSPWSPFSEKTSDIFLAVDDGEHTFEVRARDMDLNVDSTPASNSFLVIAPIWQQPWFISLILTFLSIITFFIIFLYHRNKIIHQISESKVRLFANISHELRTPLVLILGPLSKILESPYLDKQLIKPLNLVNRNTHRLLRLVNQVLDFRKMEADQLKFEPNKGNIITFLTESVDIFEEAADSKGIELKFDSQIDKLIMWFDFDKIEKIIFNILSNAIKYTPQRGKITVSASIDLHENSQSMTLEKNHTINFNNWLKIVITDSGIGIPQRNLDKIFDRFYQVKDQYTTTVGGTGIGLAVAKEMVNVHHGNIYVESKEGIGTSFNIKLPIIDEDALEGIIHQDDIENSSHIKFIYPEKEALSTETTPPQSERKENDGGKILIVEDNLDMSEYIKEELQHDYFVAQAKDGLQGFEKALNDNPDLIISDIMMPQMDGIEFCRKIKTDERTSHIAIILLTARSSQEHKIEGLETGADDYLIKPFYINELRLRINNIIESRRKFREQLGKTLEIEPSNIQITSVDQKFIKRAIEIIEENIADLDFGVEKFSRLIGVSRVGLYNKLKALTNHSVQEFIFVVKLKRAAQLIKESGMSITEITYEVGFKDPSHFSKLFKKHFGVSPKVYKNEHTHPED